MAVFRNAGVIGAIASVGVLALVGSATAGGFSKSTGSSTWGSGAASTDVSTQSGYARYRSRTWANAHTFSLHNGQIVGADGHAGNDTDFEVRGSAYYKQWNRSKAKVYAKNKNVMAKARSENHTQIYVNGKLHVVTKEVARAIARHTPLGTQAAADSEAHLTTVGSGFVSGSATKSNKASVRVRN